MTMAKHARGQEEAHASTPFHPREDDGTNNMNETEENGNKNEKTKDQLSKQKGTEENGDAPKVEEQEAKKEKPPTRIENGKDSRNEEEFSVGDHVYQWCRYGGIPGIYQKHGMVLQVDDNSLTILEFQKLLPSEASSLPSASSSTSSPSSSSSWFGLKGRNGESGAVEENGWKEVPLDEEELPDQQVPLMIQSSDDDEGLSPEKENSKALPFQPEGSGQDNLGEEGGEEIATTRADVSALLSDLAASSWSEDNEKHNESLPSYESLVLEAVRRGHATKLCKAHAEDMKKRRRWKCVSYNASAWRLSVQRSGTCTSARCDATGMVLSRVQFLLLNLSCLPPRHALYSNGECVAVWCQTGRWCTLQASSFLHTTVAGQVKSATTIGVYLSQQQVTVPAAGIWGYLGFTTKASLMATQPYLWGVVVGYGVVTVAVPLWYLQKCRGVWQETSERLNESFWSFATCHSRNFVERIADWSAY